MASVRSESDHSPSRIDHFSSLPNELLNTIFEYAYTDSAHSQPLSKRLLPFFEHHFYRKVSLSTVNQCSLFLRSITAQPHARTLISSLSTPEMRHFSQDVVDLLPRIFSLLSHLEHLDFPRICSYLEENDSQGPIPRTLKSLATSLRYRFDGMGRPHLDLDQLDHLRELPNLTDLTIYNWHALEETSVTGTSSSGLALVERLRIEGDGAEDSSVSAVTKSCPALRHLELHCTFSTGDVFLYTHLPDHTTSLESLSLTVAETATVDLSNLSNLTVFTQLRSLTLGDGCYTADIHSHLRTLPLLTHLHLGLGQIDLDGFRHLVAGPTRLQHLRTITLDLEAKLPCYKISRPSTPGFDADAELRRCPTALEDWVDFGSIMRDPYDELEMRKFVECVRENGVPVGGRILSPRRTDADYRLEANNRAVVAAYYKELWSLRRIREQGRQAGYAVFGPEGLGALEIVEIDLPERNWFALDLRSVRK